jgi:hypothetical protein
LQSHQHGNFHDFSGHTLNEKNQQENSSISPPIVMRFSEVPFAVAMPEKGLSCQITSVPLFAHLLEGGKGRTSELFGSPVTDTSFTSRSLLETR